MGLSPYILGGMQGSEYKLLVFPIPLIGWIVLRRLAGEISARRLVVGMVVLLIVQFGCFIEGFATTALTGGGIALGLGLLFTEGDAKRRLWLLVPPLASACAISAVLLSFFLYFMFAFGFQHGIILSPWLICGSSGFIVPTPLNALGRIHLLGAITANFRTSLYEPSSYIPLPLFLIVAFYARSHWRTPAGRLLVDLLIILCVLTMGPRLEIAGRITIGLPWLVLGICPC